MVHEPSTGTLVPFNFEHIKMQVPEITRLAGIIRTITFDPLIDSSEVTPENWIEIATIIEENYQMYDGFVVLHGTDTMAYTASALSFMLRHLEKPVIFTGSQLPIGLVRTDGRENLITAIEIAGSKSNGKALVPEVCIYFENNLFRGNRTTKQNTEQFNAFGSPNFPVLAEAGIDIRYNSSNILYPTVRKHFEVRKSLETNVAILKLFPGITEKTVAAISGISGLKGLILESFGAGNAPTSQWFLEKLSLFIKNGGIVLNITQCPKGVIMPDLYETGRKLSEIGVINGGDMTTEAAVTKLMFLFGNYDDRDKIEKMLKSPLRGEITV